ncbi:MAG: radical SAM protein, partial [Oligoflexia bacterium]|nr:radical SAM protein [Oligoflexia bacterium]
IGNWEKEKEIFPLYLEISPSSFCNHSCTFCAKDFVSKKNIINPEVLMSRIEEFSKVGIKSIMFAGEGEPTLYPKLPKILDKCKNVCIDTALTTNFTTPNDSAIENFIRNCTWIKISVGAGDAKTYSQIHRCDQNDFQQLTTNIQPAIKIKEQYNYPCSLGVQIILLPENKDTVIQLGKIAKDLGVNYLVVKPHSQHPYSINKQYKHLHTEYDRNELHDLENNLIQFTTNNFKIIFRRETFDRCYQKSSQQRKYTTCYSVPFFWAYIRSDGEVLGCSNWFCDSSFAYGNIHHDNFKTIWASQSRKSNIGYMKNALSVDECRINCRMDKINDYLWELLNPDIHHNFI